MTSWASIAAAAPQSAKEEKKEDLFSGSARIAVVDATALIKGFSLERICDAVVTVQDILDEVRDRQSRTWLQALPYRIQILEPEPESVKTVVRVARETGDLSFLSVPDVKILALAFEMEKRIHGTEHLSFSPRRITKRRSGTCVQPTNLPGWGYVENPKDWEAIDRLNNEEASAAEDMDTADVPRETTEGLVMCAAAEMGDLQISDPLSGSEASIDANGEEDENELSWEEERLENIVDDSFSRETTKDQSQYPIPEDDDGWQQVKRKEKKKPQKKKFRTEEPTQQGQGEEERESSVSCLTSDFGIQNVLLQMGLKLVTPDGIRIRRLSTYGIKCASCFTVSQKSEKVFCHNCGNATLYRVRIEVGEDGMQVIGGMSNPPQRRGAKCAIPPPKGGKKNKDAILSEDVMQQTMQRYRNKKMLTMVDILSPEYNEDSWFKTRSMKNEIREQLPGRFGYPKSMSKHISRSKKR